MKSKVNLELKYLIKDFRPIRKILRDIGARKIETKFQKDYFFNLPRNEDKKAPARLKLRIEKKTKTFVFYRRPTFSDISSTSADVTLLASKDPTFRFFTKVLGIKVIVEKKRELWRKGNTIFNLDRVRKVGNVFEIEVWTTPKTLKADRKIFVEYREKLLPYLSEIVKGSNEDLVSKC